MGSLEGDILVEGLADWVALGQVASFVSQRCSTVAADDVCQKGVAAIKSLLEADFVQIGEVVADEGFLAWDMPTAEIVDRVRMLWKTIDSDPYVCWLSNTDLGDKKALELFEPTYRIRRGMLNVWLRVSDVAKRLNFDCVVDTTEEGEIVGVEVGNFRQQLGDVVAVPIRGGSTIHWSYDAGDDRFYLYIAPKQASARKKTSGAARVDGQGRVVGIEVGLTAMM